MKICQCRALGTVQMGKNELIVEIPYRKKENIENLFLLENFGVTVSGRNAVRELRFFDLLLEILPDRSCLSMEEISNIRFPWKWKRI